MMKMKANILLILWIVVGMHTAVAQERNINFETGKSWKELVAKARKAGRLIFVDCYTSWCGPCKLLARDVFTDPEVADFFNANFINAKYDMEKDADGPVLKKQFGVTAFPTLVFVDPHTCEVVHRMVGAGTPAWLLGGAALAMEPDNNLRAMEKRYAAGERTAALVRNYAAALYSAYKRDEAARIACAYLDPLPVDSLCTAANWELIKRCVNDPLSASLKRVIAEREKFYLTVGRDEVDRKLEKSMLDAAMALAAWQPKKQIPFDERRQEELIHYLRETDFYAAPAALAWLYTASYLHQEDFRGMFRKMKEVMSYNLFRHGGGNVYLRENLRKFIYSDDKELMTEAIHWIDTCCAASANSLDKANFMRIKAILQQKTGDNPGSRTSRNETDRYMQEFRERKR